MLHLVENMSDHEVFYVKFEVTNEPTVIIEEIASTVPKLNWKAATEDQKLEYEDKLFRKLNTLHVPEAIINCKNVHCEDTNHRLELDSYVVELMSFISESGHDAIPVKESKPAKKPKSKSLAGWKDYVEPFQRNAQFWYSIWLSAGKPINTELHRIMKRAKNIFHYQVRRCRRVEDYLKNNKIDENCLENDTDLFEEIKKQRKVGSDDDVTIDGAAGKDIPNEFAKVYKELYHREKYEAEIDAIMTNLNQHITENP